MALSRKFLTAMGIDEDKVDEIIKAHSETVEALKEDRDSYKEKAGKYDKAKSDLDEANRKIGEFTKEDSYKVKYEALKEDFDNYKKDSEAQKTKASKTDALRSLLKEIGISEKRIDSVLKVTSLDNIKLGEDGKIEESGKLKKSLSEEWADFIVTAGKEGAKTSTPPGAGGNGTKTREEIMKIKDTQERQKAWAELIRNGGNQNVSN